MLLSCLVCQAPAGQLLFLLRECVYIGMNTVDRKGVSSLSYPLSNVFSDDGKVVAGRWQGHVEAVMDPFLSTKTVTLVDHNLANNVNL